MRVPPALIAAAVLWGASPAFARAEGRVVQIRWDDTGRSLEVWINCADEVCDDGEKLAGSKAYLFQLDQKDAVTLHMIATVPDERPDAVRLDISYTVIGDDPDKAAQAALGKAFPAGAGKKGPEAATVIEETLPVTDRLLAGGKLTVTFERSLMKNDKPVPQSSKTLIFGIRDAYPWFAASYGIVATTGRETDVDIVNTGTVVTFTKDGKTQQALEQKLVVRGEDEDVRPVQSVVSFLNFRVGGPFYGSLGFRLDQQIFKEPLVGVSYMRRVRGIGLVVTTGVHLSEETEILRGSGFTSGQMIDPVLGLTASSIPTEDRYHLRWFIGFSARY